MPFEDLVSSFVKDRLIVVFVLPVDACSTGEHVSNALIGGCNCFKRISPKSQSASKKLQLATHATVALVETWNMTNFESESSQRSILPTYGF